MPRKVLSFLRSLSIRNKALFIFALAVLVFLAVPPVIIKDVQFSRAVQDRSFGLLRLTLSADDKYRLFVPLSNISPVLVKSVLLYEDKYFYDHPGVNPVAILRAGRRHITDSGRGGASTITMQLARMKYSIHSRGIPGKLWQMAQALRIELHYSKDEILEAYLNLAPYGSNIEGVGAASYIYFGQSPDNLSLPEALTFAVIPQSPARRTPGRNRETGAALARARSHLFEQWVHEYPRDKHYTAIIEKPMHYGSKKELPFLAPQLTGRMLREQKSNIVETTIDRQLQQQLAGLVRRYANNRMELGIHNAAALLVDNQSHEVLASIGSTDYFDTAHLGMLDGTRVRRSPGSTLKPFIYALAFDQGIIHPLSLLKDAPVAFANFTPDNFDRQYEGPLSAHDALIKSRNIPALWLAEQLKRPDFYQFLANSGIKNLKPENSYGLSLVLGGAELTMEELTQLYVMLANGGSLEALRYIKNAPAQGRKNLLSPEASFITLDILKDTPPPGGATISDSLPYPVYWKTGTSSGLRDAWSIGVFGRYTLAVWVGDFRGGMHGKYVGFISAAPLFFEIVRLVAAKEKASDLIEVKAPGLHLARKLACSDTGDIDSSYCLVRQQVWMIPGVSPIKASGIYRRVLVNNSTGQLACRFRPDVTSYRVMQFWPSDLTEVYAKAGIIKSPPPAWEEGCESGHASNKITSPHIVSPAKGVMYHVREGNDNRLELKASVDGGVHTAFWFVNNELIGKAKAGEQLFWELKRGRFVVRVVDDAGNSDSRHLSVE